MTNHLRSLELENIGHACYFAVSTWLSNFYHVFSNPLGTFSSKWSLYKSGRKFWDLECI